MSARKQRGVELVFEVPRWSERWALEDDVTMPESDDHRRITRLLEDILRAWVARRGSDAKVLGNHALRWVEEHPQVGVDPDVMLVEPAPPDAPLQSVRTWEAGHHAPRVAIEVVSRSTARKDYGEGPAKYAASGTRELWVFDPEGRGRGLMGGPWTLQVWRRGKGDSFRQEYAGDGPAYSEELAAWLVVTEQGTQLRIADDEAGETLWRTAEEIERERADAERERADAERERAEAERKRADAAIAELAALKAALAASPPTRG